MQLGLLSIKEKGKVKEIGIKFAKKGKIKEFLEALPYSLTNAQKRVWEEICVDMESDKPMNRLVQGDVGSGKTAVATLALLKAVRKWVSGSYDGSNSNSCKAALPSGYQNSSLRLE